MEYFKIADKYYGRLSHYKNRTPPWIKIHNDFLEDYEFSKLTDQEKYHFIASMLLASRCNNKIVYDSDWVRQKFNARSKINLNLFLEKGFIEKISIENNDLDSEASSVLAKCKQPATKVVAQSRIEESRIEKKRGEGDARERASTNDPPPEILYKILTANGRHFNLDRTAVDAYVARFSNLDVALSLNKIEGHAEANPHWRFEEVPTKINHWLSDDEKRIVAMGA